MALTSAEQKAKQIVARMMDTGLMDEHIETLAAWFQQDSAYYSKERYNNLVFGVWIKKYHPTVTNPYDAAALTSAIARYLMGIIEE